VLACASTRSAPESVCDGSGAGDGNGLEPLSVAAACESIWGVAGGNSHDVNVLGVVLMLGEATIFCFS